jgi:hypothetical protein
MKQSSFEPPADLSNGPLNGQNAGGPVSTTNALPAIPGRGELNGSPVPIPVTTNEAVPVADSVDYDEGRATRHNAEIWGAWCNDATGYSFEE